MSVNYYTPKRLREIGISEHTADLSDLILNGTVTYKAFCKSRKCSGNNMSTGVEKKVRQDVEVCPDCNYFLFWKTICTSKNDRKTKDDQRSSQLPLT